MSAQGSLTERKGVSASVTFGAEFRGLTVLHTAKKSFRKYEEKQKNTASLPTYPPKCTTGD